MLDLQITIHLWGPKPRLPPLAPGGCPGGKKGQQELDQNEGPLSGEPERDNGREAQASPGTNSGEELLFYQIKLMGGKNTNVSLIPLVNAKQQKQVKSSSLVAGRSRPVCSVSSVPRLGRQRNRSSGDAALAVDGDFFFFSFFHIYFP